MDLRSVRDAYSSKSQQYVDLFDGDWDADKADATFIRRHLAGSEGPVLDLGCGPGHWTADLHQRGVQVTGIDVVPEFISHARANHPGPEFRLDSMTDLNLAANSIAGILSWYSTIHVPPADLDGVLAEFRRLLAPSGTLVLGFFDSDDEVASFDHAVHTAYRWPCDLMVRRVTEAGFAEVERLQREFAERPGRKYAAVAARAV
ncbi:MULTISPECIES: class I SAM-dependent methyltransferase [Nocardioides]|uniref:Class I SAM-dependent methyltransferase n=1 Tax=Nocardioides faecalis TaxID=2803858 RepID=A0A938Y4M6_9ACTN|nr:MULTISPECIES: class I SAM-dependent methyltransferase [Nocardioides]MBM9461806.1 class I SAM-dependent methyltransferase [Nocardioides faecalis]MCD4524023.1 class I SAM-dependent methyltransferase [Nocardioides sp. cx-173]QVI59953.1 class I SAM-dependent methyltransferase [Nocardioides faecalis]QVI60157.1 class I SAM-dependent methyltransferase [Nocardioides faecalis]UGB41424.1 class I SAM-dependent methyltransferase [Nocardioides sp. cx-173]